MFTDPQVILFVADWSEASVQHERTFLGTDEAVALLTALAILGARAAGCSSPLPAVTPSSADGGVEHLPAPA